jgi:hypothetical protein
MLSDNVDSEEDWEMVLYGTRKKRAKNAPTPSSILQYKKKKPSMKKKKRRGSLTKKPKETAKVEETKTTTLSVPPGSSSNSKCSDKVWGEWKSPPNIFNNGKDVFNVLPALGAPPGSDSSRSGQELASLTVAAQQMNTLLKNRYGALYIYTAREVLFFAKD